jgi:hypothetical protein
MKLAKPSSIVSAVVLLVLLLVPSGLHANTVYISQNGGSFSGGSACNGQSTQPVSYFNNGGNWGSGSNQIGPGTTVYLCGTFTASGGASEYLVFQGGGSSGSPVTLQFDTGADVQALAWSGPAIDINGHSYVTINGGSNGTIEATANGTNLGNQQDNGTCVANHSGNNITNVVVENLRCSDLYVDASTSDGGGEDTYGIDVWNASNLSIKNNTIHDMKWAIRNSFNIGNTYSNVSVSGNNIYNMDHGYFMTDSDSGGSATLTGLYIYGNTFGSMTNWDNSNDNNHHDWIHLATNSTGTHFSQIYAYNNTGKGDVGYNANAGFFGDPSAPAAISAVYFYNNVYYNTSSSHCWADGFISWIAGSLTAVNNTFLSNDSSCVNNGNSNPGDNGVDWDSGSSGLTLENNIMQTMDDNFVYAAGGTSISTINDNDYYAGGGWTWMNDGNTDALSTWRGWCDCDGNSITGNPNLTSSYIPQSGSPVAGAGVNLYNMCSGQSTPGLGPLCSDLAGNARPSSGGWAIGAYQIGGSAAPNPPTGLTATAH